jgi:hypothetical protein
MAAAHGAIQVSRAGELGRHHIASPSGHISLTAAADWRAQAEVAAMLAATPPLPAGAMLPPLGMQRLINHQLHMATLAAQASAGAGRGMTGAGAMQRTGLNRQLATGHAQLPGGRATGLLTCFRVWGHELYSSKFQQYFRKPGHILARLQTGATACLPPSAATVMVI